MTDHLALDSRYLEQRRAVTEAVAGMAKACGAAGVSDHTLKAALVALREPHVALLADEEAEGLIERLGLGGA